MSTLTPHHVNIYKEKINYWSAAPFAPLSTNKTAGPATIVSSDRSLPLEVASANTVPDTLEGTTTLEFLSIATNRVSSADWNTIKVALTEVDGRCTVTFCPGMGAPVILKDGKVFKFRGGLVDGHETMNGDANVKASSASIGVYDNMDQFWCMRFFRDLLQMPHPRVLRLGQHY